MINGEDFVGPEQKGRVVTILGDTLKHPNSIQLAKDADVLVHESTFGSNEEDLARQYNHSTTTQAAQIAKEAGVNKLLLTHFSSRYLYKDMKQLKKEAKAIFPNTCLMKDLQEISIPLKREGSEE